MLVAGALLVPAQAQFWGQWDSRQQQQRQPQRQQQYNPFGGGWFGAPQDSRPRQQQRDTPPDYSKAPNAQRKGDNGVTTPIVVLGDGMADWLAYGLEDAFSEKPEISIVRRQRANAGLIRYDPRRDNIEWPQVVRETITADKPKFILMMVGINDRQSIRERGPAPAAAAANKPGAPPAPVDPEQQAQQSADRQNMELQEEDVPRAAPDRPSPTGTFEFHTEKWAAAYIKRIDATIATMKTAGVPVIWVGLPPQKNARASSDAAYLNELFRASAEKASITYVDVWDGFVDDAGRFTVQGPDYQGQTRQLRANDGVYFTKAGARKLAHYVEREIERNIANRTIAVTLPTGEPERTPSGRGNTNAGNSSGRPLAGPVIPLTLAASAANDALLGAAAAPKPAIADPIAQRVLTKGEPIAAMGGRADDFVWPRNNTVVVEPAPRPAVAAPAAPAAPAPKGAAPKRAPQVASNPPAAAPPAAAPSPEAASAAAVPEGEPAAPPKKRAKPKASPAPRPPVGLSFNPFGPRTVR
jgi:uncharacterized protein